LDRADQGRDLDLASGEISRALAQKLRIAAKLAQEFYGPLRVVPLVSSHFQGERPAQRRFDRIFQQRSTLMKVDDTPPKARNQVAANDSTVPMDLPAIHRIEYSQCTQKEGLACPRWACQGQPLASTNCQRNTIQQASLAVRPVSDEVSGL
jgi:hypothetical protein